MVYCARQMSIQAGAEHCMHHQKECCETAAAPLSHINKSSRAACGVASGARGPTFECGGTEPLTGWTSSSGLPPDAAKRASLAPYEALSRAKLNGMSSSLHRDRLSFVRIPSWTCRQPGHIENASTPTSSTNQEQLTVKQSNGVLCHLSAHTTPLLCYAAISWTQEGTAASTLTYPSKVDGRPVQSDAGLVDMAHQQERHHNALAGDAEGPEGLHQQITGRGVLKHHLIAPACRATTPSTRHHSTCNNEHMPGKAEQLIRRLHSLNHATSHKVSHKLVSKDWRCVIDSLPAL